MPGLRRLREVGSKISGALAGPRDEVTDAASAAGSPAADRTPDPTPDQTPQAPHAGDAQEALVPVLDSTDQPSGTDQPGSTDQPGGTDEPGSTAAPADVTRSDPADADDAGPATEVDARCAAAADVARAVAVEVAGDAVGEHLGVEPEPSADGYAATHSFATREAGYVGWRWAVTVARAEGVEAVTVDEVVLLPGSGALLAPEWVPWDRRLQPGDLGPGDLLPPAETDPRLVPGYAEEDEELPFDLNRDLGLGRPRVLSTDGRSDAAERWYDGPAGPGAPIAKQAPGRCVDCGFLVLLAGALGRGFGACANAMAPDDGRVVALQHGCGAHSEQPTASTTSAATGMAVEHEELELVDVAALPAGPDDDSALPDSPDDENALPDSPDDDVDEGAGSAARP